MEKGTQLSTKLNWDAAQKALRMPFETSEVYWKPGIMSRDGSRAAGFIYADTRTYQERLDEVVGPDWTVEYVPWGDSRIICRLTLYGVTRSATGEHEGTADENAGTSSEAQAFKRACAAFGLGRYFYQMPRTWVPYDKDNRRFTPAALTILEQVHEKARELLLNGERLTEEALSPQSITATPSQLARPEPPSAIATPTNMDEYWKWIYGVYAPKKKFGREEAQLIGKEALESADGHIEIAFSILMDSMEEDPTPIPPPAEAPQPDEVMCPIHNVAMREYSNAKGSWHSHRLDDGTWCNGKPPKGK